MKINLLELLKGHEGESFYSPVLGEMTLIRINDDIDDDYPLEFEDFDGCTVYLTAGGKYNIDAERTLFPSKEQRDWNKWAKEVKLLPKTWEDILDASKYDFETIKKVSSIGKQFFSFYKINKLIEAGYGGNITDSEWKDVDCWKYAIICANDGTLSIGRTISRTPIAFHSREKAEKFLSYSDNVQLIKDFYGVACD